MVEPRKARNFYGRLGVRPDASADTIKAAYRKLAFVYHPDRNKGPNAGENFKALGEAYDTLRNPNKKRVYDGTQFMGGLSFSRGGDSASDYTADQEGVYQRTRTKKTSFKVQVGGLEMPTNNTFESLTVMAGQFYGL